MLQISTSDQMGEWHRPHLFIQRAGIVAGVDDNHLKGIRTQLIAGKVGFCRA